MKRRYNELLNEHLNEQDLSPLTPSEVSAQLDELQSHERDIRALNARIATLNAQMDEAVRIIRAGVNNADSGQCQTLWSEQYTRENQLGSRVANHDSAAEFLSRHDGSNVTLREALRAMLNTYAPLAAETVVLEGEHALHSAVRQARAALAIADGAR